MEINFAEFNWLAVLVSVIAGQAISTVWFVVLFGEAWAKEYGAPNAQQHTKEIPPYTYAVGLVCTFALVLSIATVQSWLAISTVPDAITSGLFIAIGFCVATGLPGQAFLRRYRVAVLAYGSQTAMIVAISLILALWK